MPSFNTSFCNSVRLDNDSDPDDAMDISFHSSASGSYASSSFAPASTSHGDVGHPSPNSGESNYLDGGSIRKRRRISLDYDPGSPDRFIPERTSGDCTMLYKSTSHDLTSLTVDTKTHRWLNQNGSALQGNVRMANARYRGVLTSICVPDNDSTPPSSSPSSPEQSRILSFSPQPKSPSSATRAGAQLDSVEHSAYTLPGLSLTTRKKLTAPTKRMRDIATGAYKVLDAPDLENNFYMNLIDWSSKDQMAVVLGRSIYIYQIEGGRVEALDSVLLPSLYTSSVRWLSNGHTLAAGNKRGDLVLYDAATQKRTHTMPGQNKRIGSIASMGSLVATGSADSTILLRDIRVPTPVRKISAHTAEVCGLRFSAFDEPVLASGGDDCKLYIWDLRMTLSDSSNSKPPSAYPSIHRGRLSTSPLTNLAQASPPQFGAGGTSELDGDKEGHATPLLKLTEHRAAVKGLAWSPHTRGLLASGGGREDPIIRFWNTTTGKKIDQVQCQAQVTNLAWSVTSDELLSTHGYGSSYFPGMVTIWHYPSRSANVSFSAHNERVLYLAMDPNGQSIATASNDQTLRFFNVFPPKNKRNDERASDLLGKIR